MKRYNNEIDELIFGINGLRGLKNYAITEGVTYAVRSVRKHFGIDMTITNPRVIRTATLWIKKYDSNFIDHISNPYDLRKVEVHDEIINDKFFVILRKDTFMYISGHVSDLPVDDNNKYKLFIYIFGKKCYAYFNELSTFIEENQESGNLLYSVTGNDDGNGRSNWFVTATPLQKRPMNTIFLDGNIKEEVMSHIDKWIKNIDVYKKRGLPFKTGILFYGIPGTGKSSMATAIASYLDCGLINIDMSKFDKINLSEVSESINADEDRYVILIDEIDTVFSSRDNERASDQEKSNISKLLSFLDSPQSPTNVIIVATTNYYDKLDEAVIRKGRFDLICHLEPISVKTAIEMCESFGCTKDQADEILKNYTDDFENGINPSSLQADILNYIAKNGESNEYSE